MKKRKLAYIWSLRNAAADKAGQYVPYKGEERYMKSVLEFLVESLNQTSLGDHYELVGVIYDDDPQSPRDQEKIRDYGFAYQPGRQWFYPADLEVQGKRLNDLLLSVPSTYRRHPRGTPEHIAGKQDFERRLHDTLVELGTDVAVLDGLLVILDELVRPGAPFARRIMNIHPGVTREDSPYERRGAYATLDALHGARGEKVVNWTTLEKVAVEPLYWTGASFHYVDNGIDSGEVFHDVLKTQISPEDNILELRWNNFNNSLFPALHEGLALLAEKQGN
ncbi:MULTISPECIES: N(5)-hydroxyornithine transformylase PvdF [unclassified Pseudomonas]|uniref:N(5)-hydroxyornithine transformylase PvdF n=1 Tax=unclassified Pseudomonas TaxID=196821 RepID=UPI0023D8C119|nr:MULTISPECIES: N(5)-hydroxyornithine transformylase PvdF [unclassified Pseudomonas]MED5608740.1 N(5)-hydroxyornithine transformylase PvdF [Pseudomonas sp. JH-2]